MTTGKQQDAGNTTPAHQADLLEVIYETAQTLATAAMRMYSDKADETLRYHFETITEALGTYSPATVRRIHARSTTPDDIYLAELILSYEDEEFINDALMLRGLLWKAEITPGKATCYIRGISHYAGIEPQDNGEYPARRLAQATAVLRTILHLKQNNVSSDVNVASATNRKPAAYIADKRTRNLIINHPDPERLADLIITRNLTTSDEIIALVDTMNLIAPSLRSGTL